MKKLFYIVMATFISVFAISCEDDAAGDGDGISGTWSGVSYAINFSVTLTDSEGNEEEISCSSELLQGSEDACESFPCDWDEETESCGAEAAYLFSDDDGGVILTLGSDGMAAWAELWEESYDGQTYIDECASTGTWTSSSGNINLTSTTGENMDDCNVFVAISENPIPYTASGDDMSWTIPLLNIYDDDYYYDDYDYYDDEYPDFDLSNSSMTIIWSK